MYILITKILNKLFLCLVNPMIRHSLGKCGKNVFISRGIIISGNKNIFIGNDVSIGPRCTLYCTRAPITFGDHIIVGPNVTMISGDHRTDCINKPMSMIKENEKSADNDKPIFINDDVWIGANVTVLKGVTIGQGSVIAAGTVVTKNVPQCVFFGGNPGRILKKRFSSEALLLEYKRKYNLNFDE